MLRLFLDESSDPDQVAPRVVSVAGLIGPAEAWDRFESRWVPALREFGVAELHMKDLGHFRGEYYEWGEEKRRGFLARFLELLENERGALIPLGYSASLDAYRVGVQSVAEDAVTLSELCIVDVTYQPIFLCYQGVMHHAIRVLEERPNAEAVEVYFDERTDSHRLRGWHDQIRESRKERIRPLSFLSSAGHPSIQAADFVAYELAKQENDPTRPRYTFARLQTLKPRFSH